jgi:uncharacterized RDD family membrane protein YckC
MQSDINPYEPPGSEVAGVPVAMELAGKGRRFATFVIDYLGFFLFAAGVGVAVGIAFGQAGMAALHRVPGTLLGMGIFFIYYLFFEGVFGRTPGKWLLGTVVVDESGRPPSFGQVLGRTACRFIPFEPLSFFGTLGWHDGIPKTRVIRTPRG